MKVCPHCNTPNNDEFTFCKACGERLDEDIEISSSYTTEYQQPVAPPPVPNVMPPVAIPQREGYNWCDVCAIIGFICSIIGLFTFAIILLPLGLITSLIGCFGKHLKGLAVAGISISLVATLVRVGMILYENAMIPDWIISGLFW
ncbi:zinc ribbon domain-containing protein [Massilioclostridium coli]|uniref:zinc ribbon domain-containing protein n=1 Tax=Massilioclostridium coli TaxID=1870991 RepID=UPI00085CA8EA|nr:zinc ribbon domain-containing protein [Massilioclostridium coli]